MESVVPTNSKSNKNFLYDNDSIFGKLSESFQIPKVSNILLSF